jgi:hypothetical protein
MADDNGSPLEPPASEQPKESSPKEKPYEPPPGLGPDFVRKIAGKPNKKSS